MAQKQTWFVPRNHHEEASPLKTYHIEVTCKEKTATEELQRTRSERRSSAQYLFKASIRPDRNFIHCLVVGLCRYGRWRQRETREDKERQSGCSASRRIGYIQRILERDESKEVEKMRYIAGAKYTGGCLAPNLRTLSLHLQGSGDWHCRAAMRKPAPTLINISNPRRACGDSTLHLVRGASLQGVLKGPKRQCDQSWYSQFGQ